MIDSTKFLVISKSNYRQYATTAPGGVFPHQQFVEVLRGSTGYKGWQDPSSPHVFRGPKQVTDVPQSQWADMIRAGAGLKSFNKPLPAKDQDGLSLCWCYGSTRAVEYRRQLEGLPYLQLAPESIDVEVNGGRNEGGYASQAFDAIQAKGICEQSFLPAVNSLKYKQWKTGWQDNAASHEVVDWFQLDNTGNVSFADVMTCLLNDSPVAAGLDWWGHLVCFVAPVLLSNGTFGVLFQNSWGPDWPTAGANGFAILTQDMGTPDGAASPIITVDSPVPPPAPPSPDFPIPPPLFPPVEAKASKTYTGKFSVTYD